MGKEVFSKNIRVSDKPVKDWIPYESGYGIKYDQLRYFLP